MAWGYHSLWKLYEKKWDNVIEAAKLYDFDRDGRAMGEIIYKEE